MILSIYVSTGTYLLTNLPNRFYNISLLRGFESIHNTSDISISTLNYM